MIKIGLTMSIELSGLIIQYTIPTDYIKAVADNGAVPVLIPTS